MMTKIADAHPPRHAKSIVKRDGCIFTATPCYGLHNPWWTVITMDGEAEPVPFRDTDEWEPLEKPMQRITDVKWRTQPAAICVLMMPKNTNANGSIFGGVLLSHIDQAGAIGAQRHTKETLVTVAMDKVIFKEPVFVGDVVSFYTSLVKVGNTSITVKVEVEAMRGQSPGSKPIPVTEATLVFVAVNDERKPIPINPVDVYIPRKYTDE